MAAAQISRGCVSLYKNSTRLVEYTLEFSETEELPRNDCYFQARSVDRNPMIPDCPSPSDLQRYAALIFVSPADDTGGSQPDCC